MKLSTWREYSKRDKLNFGLFEQLGKKYSTFLQISFSVSRAVQMIGYLAPFLRDSNFGSLFNINAANKKAKGVANWIRKSFCKFNRGIFKYAILILFLALCKFANIFKCLMLRYFCFRVLWKFNCEELWYYIPPISGPL